MQSQFNNMSIVIVLAMCNCSETLCRYNKCPVMCTSIKLVPVLLFRKFVCIK
jgi:hypothetical protein